MSPLADAHRKLLHLPLVITPREVIALLEAVDDFEPLGRCVDCGAPIPTAYDLCEDCLEKRAEWLQNAADPRRG